jgi:hypothetical protein
VPIRRPVLTCLLLGLITAGQPCTVFVVARDGQVLAGNNEDYYGKNRTWLRFLPKGKAKYGAVAWGHAGIGNEFPQGGMNEAGLFYDGNALQDNDAKASARPQVTGKATQDLMYRVLRECGTVDEAVELLRRYELPEFGPAQLVFGDRTGKSTILERNALTAGNGSLQIGTNFRTSKTAKPDIICPRYKAAESILGSLKPLTVDLARDALAAAKQEGGVLTVYSTVCDLKAGAFWLYYRSDFKHGKRFDLKRELSKGDRVVMMDILFTSNVGRR